jgi:ribose transport system substrate-binding protein
VRAIFCKNTKQKGGVEMLNTKKSFQFISFSAAIVFFAGIVLLCFAATSNAAEEKPTPGTIVQRGVPWADTSKFKKNPPWVIGYSNPSLSNEWRVYMVELMKYYAEQNPKLVKKLYITDSEDNPIKQIADTEDLAVKGIDILLSSPCTPAANPGQEAIFRKGTPVVQFDRTGGTEEFTCTQLTQELEVGRKLTEWLVKAMGGKGNIVVFSGVPGSWPSEGRLMAMKQVLAKYPDVKIVGGPVYTFWSMASAKKAMEDFIAGIPKIDGIWSDSGMMAKPAMEAWLEAGKKPIPCAGDVFNGWLKMWKTKKLPGYATTNVPLFCGVLGMAAAFQILNGEPVARTSEYPVYEITEENLDKWVRMDLSDAYFSFDSVPGFFQAPEELKKKLFSLK